MLWHTLGYIPNFDAVLGSKKYSVDTKHNDFNFCLRYLLSGLEKLLSFSEGFHWNFEFKYYPNKKYKRNTKLVLANVLGDVKGANILCSKFVNITNSNIARNCNVLTDACDNPYHKLIFHKQKDLNKLYIEDLKELSFHRAKPCNEFLYIDFGANYYGINGAYVADTCYMLNRDVVVFF